jgi:hypothetical protein
VTTTTTITTEEKYRVLAPESMQETFMSDSEDEGGKFYLIFACFWSIFCVLLLKMVIVLRTRVVDPD